MSPDSERTRWGLDKIVMLGLFAASLLIANFIVVQRAVLKLSKPIELSESGLSVAIPSGNGWHSPGKWQYQGNSYYLISDFNSIGGEPLAKVICRYYMTAWTIPAQVWFEQQARTVEGKILETGKWSHDTLTINGAYIEKPEMMLCMFIGTTELSSNRRLDIEVSQFGGDAEDARKIFNEIINNIRFKDNMKKD
jgi:hypothetical protein